jgi:hypothetical protein
MIDLDRSSGRDGGGGGSSPVLHRVQRLLTGILIAVMTVVAVAMVLAVRGIPYMEAGFVLRMLAAATLVGTLAGSWIGGGRWPRLAALVCGASATGAFLALVLRTSRACERLDLGVRAASLEEPLPWLVPLLLLVAVVAGWGAARLRGALS